MIVRVAVSFSSSFDTFVTRTLQVRLSFLRFTIVLFSSSSPLNEKIFIFDSVRLPPILASICLSVHKSVCLSSRAVLLIAATVLCRTQVFFSVQPA